MLNFHKESVRYSAVIKLLAVSILFFFFFVSFLQRHVYNHDFWWHLATGKYIVENKSLPQNDPFSYTSHEVLSERKSIILKGNWLAEVIFYKVYNLWDLKGIIVLRAMLMFLFLMFIFLNIKKQGSSDLSALLLTSGVFILSMGYLGERPQLFTFLAFSVTFYLLEDFRINKSKKIYLIPALVVLLSNMHPGYIVCILLISLYLAGEVLFIIFNRGKRDEGFRDLLIVWVLAVISSNLNPTGLSAFGGIFSMGEHTKGIVEFMPPFYIYANKFKPMDYSYILFLLSSLLSLRYLKKIGITHILALIVFTIMSLIAIRFVIFYMCVAAVILSRVISNLKEERIFRDSFKIKKEMEVFLYLIIFIIGVVINFNSIPSLARYEFRADTAASAPEGAADFLSGLEIRGNMFNEYGFGGYLIWRLYPDKKVFIDGRSLEPDVYKEYNIVAQAFSGRGMSWEDSIKRHDISYVVTPPLLPRGEIYPIVEKLLDSEEWVLIYNDQLSLIFLKKNNRNIDILKEHSRGKKEAFDTIIVQASGRALKNKANPYYLITLGKLFYKMGRIDDARKAFEMANKRDSENPEAREWLRIMEGNR